MAKLSIQNQYLKATFNTKGAELISLKKNALEYIWKGDAMHWGKHAPHLFPIIGTMLHNQYLYKEQKYTITKHGFARDMEFKVVEQKKDVIVFELTENEETLRMYPFKFVLKITYTLTENSLNTSYAIENPNATILYFSIGGHPAFSCPMEALQKREEYTLVFDKEIKPKATDMSTGFISGTTFKVFTKKGSLDISNTLFNNDAIVFCPNPFEKVSLVHLPSKTKYLTIHFKNFPYLGIWSASPTAPFVCIEPWQGIPDYANHQQDITKKEGIIALKSNESFSCNYTITCYQ